MSGKIFDSHAHYYDKVFDPDRDELLASIKEKGVARVVNVGANMKSSEQCIELSEKYDLFYASVGVHPDDVNGMTEEWIDRLSELSKSRKCVAIGEIGLDYHGFDIYENKPSKELQIKWFKRQLELALELRLPVIIHTRNAAQDTYDIMKEAHKNGLKDAVIHCYSGNQELAKGYIEMGYYIGIGGVVTYQHERKLSKVLGITPLSSILIETDCPYLAPEPFRYERNNSGYLTYVRDKLAEIKGVSPQEVEDITWDNANRFYRIDN